MLEIEGLSKTYPLPPRWLRALMRTAANEPVTALRDIDLEVPAGRIVGLLGPNGAGKTTLIKIVSGLLVPTTGEVRIGGEDVQVSPIEAKRRLGLVLADDRGLQWRLSGRENLLIFGVLAGLDRRRARERAEVLLERFGLAHRDRLVFGYSSGMRARLAIARALMADPPLLVLDEATRSMDPVASSQFNTELRRLADDGTAILLSSHRLDEVRATCDEIAVLVDGRLRRRAAVHELSDHVPDLLELLTPPEGAS